MAVQNATITFPNAIQNTVSANFTASGIYVPAACEDLTIVITFFDSDDKPNGQVTGTPTTNTTNWTYEVKCPENTHHLTIEIFCGGVSQERLTDVLVV